MAICNCENIRHDLANTMPDLAPEIPRDGHAIFTEQEGSHPHAYVGDVCTACHTSCFADL